LRECWSVFHHELRGYRQHFLIAGGLPPLQRRAIQTLIRLAAIYGRVGRLDQNSQIEGVRRRAVSLHPFRFSPVCGRIAGKICPRRASSSRSASLPGDQRHRLLHTPHAFFGLAFLLCMWPGGIQVAQRSLFARMIPQHKSSEYSYFSRCSKVRGDCRSRALRVVGDVSVSAAPRVSVILFSCRRPDLTPATSPRDKHMLGQLRLKVVIAAARASSGRALRDRLAPDGNEVVLLTRRPRTPALSPGTPLVPPVPGRHRWTAPAGDHLAGEPIDGALERSRKSRFSRAVSMPTRALCGRSRRRAFAPRVLVNASAVCVAVRNQFGGTDHNPPPARFSWRHVRGLGRKGRWEFASTTRVVLVRRGLCRSRLCGACLSLARPVQCSPAGMVDRAIIYIFVDITGTT